MQIAIVAALILCNGLLSMSEFAVVSSTRPGSSDSQKRAARARARRSGSSTSRTASSRPSRWASRSS
ncbi:MAG: hypothetical protein ACOC6J_06300, partial [Spirochaetota bacterium]